MMFRLETRRLAAIVVSLVAGAYVSGAGAQWAWKEDGGRVVYSDRPPPASVKSTQILRQPATAPLAARPQAAAQQPSPTLNGEPPAAAEPKAAVNAPKTLAEQEMEFRKRQQERANAERKAEEEQKKAATKAVECERARGHLRSLEDGVRIVRTDASGNREFLNDAQRASEIERTRKAMQSLCN